MTTTTTDDDRDSTATSVPGEQDADPDRERTGIRRANLVERYAAERDRLRENARSDTTEASTPTRIRNYLTAVVPEWSTALDDARDRTTATITGIETVPEIDTESIDATLDHIQTTDLKSIRFELDGDEYTRWYEWAPTDPDAPLNKIIHYYTDGNLGELFSADTTVEVEKGTGDPYILHPTPFTSRIAHRSFPLINGLRRLDTLTGGRPLIVRRANDIAAHWVIDGSGEDIKIDLHDKIITTQSDQKLTLSAHFKRILSAIPAGAFVWGLLGFFALFVAVWAQYPNADTITADMYGSLLPFARLLGWMAVIGGVATVAVCKSLSSSMWTALGIALLLPCQMVLSIPTGLWRRGWQGIRSVIARIDSYNPYE